MKTVFSGVQPSGNLHIGNYIGALSQWVKIQENSDAFFCIVDLHAITVPQDPKTLKEKVLEVAALYIACGIDPQKAHIFIQSENPDHTSLAWILNCIAPIGQLRRMTQFKDKAELADGTMMHLVHENLIINDFKKGLSGDMSRDDLWKSWENDVREYQKALKRHHKNNQKLFLTSAGLFDYPVLMAADILLYSTDEVPVGEDQKQHIELTRDLAEKFNKKYGEVFKLPVPVIQRETARIMSLQNPASKMSKSDKDPLGTINLLDTENKIREKIKRAVTDSGPSVSLDPSKAVDNLVTIYAAFNNKDFDKSFIELQGKSYGELKNILADLLVQKLSEIQKKYKEIRNDDKLLRQILDEGREYAKTKSSQTLKIVKEKLGLSA